MAVKSNLTDVIGNSPLSTLERHVRVCADCVNLLTEYFEAAQAGEWNRASDLRDKIAKLESIADDLKLEVRSNLPRGLWMSVSRADLLELVRMQDKMANDTKDVAGLSLGRELAFPAKLEKSLFKYLAAITDCTNQAVEVIVALRELSRSAFGSRQVDAIAKMVTMVEKVERKSDDQQQALRAKLRKYEADLSPIDAVFLYQLLSQIGEIADSAEKVSHRAQIISAS
jgi:predicted phosphate transport protein (TIGR00153 family)